MNTNLELYKVFYYVAKNKNITKAANEMMISQPAISKSIKTLEGELNTTLFNRKRDGVSLTEAGEVIFNKIKASMELITSAEDDLKSLNNLEYGTINIGSSETIVNNYLLNTIIKFHKLYPNIKINIHTLVTSELIKKAKLGLIDIIFTNFPYEFSNDFNTYKLTDLHDIFVASNKFNNLKNKKISKNDLEKLPLILLPKGSSTRIYFDDYCIKNNIKINPIMELGSNLIINEFVKNGFGVGFVTKEYFKEEMNNNDLFEVKTDFTLDNKYLGYAILKIKNHNIIVNKFISILKQDK